VEIFCKNELEKDEFTEILNNETKVEIDAVLASLYERHGLLDLGDLLKP
jgi:hypothetical protein